MISKKSHDCSTCVWAERYPEVFYTPSMGGAPEEACYHCCLNKAIVEEHDLGFDCADWADADTLPEEAADEQ